MDIENILSEEKLILSNNAVCDLVSDNYAQNNQISDNQISDKILDDQIPDEIPNNISDNQISDKILDNQTLDDQVFDKIKKALVFLNMISLILQKMIWIYTNQILNYLNIKFLLN
ncbi:hypothetical protein CE11_00603 [Megavirus courdo11]|uniref:Uncharacterized protein n=1 Tax=Megavirus courdo11 TaxID=1128140 RepID=K7YH75_9VIRU|nr:hypothetical protein CE11_00603 [Megavirus courdo11]